VVCDPAPRTDYGKISESAVDEVLLQLLCHVDIPEDRGEQKQERKQGEQTVIAISAALPLPDRCRNFCSTANGNRARHGPAGTCRLSERRLDPTRRPGEFPSMEYRSVPLLIDPADGYRWGRNHRVGHSADHRPAHCQAPDEEAVLTVARWRWTGAFSLLGVRSGWLRATSRS